MVHFYRIRREMCFRKAPALHEHARRDLGLGISVHDCFVFCERKEELTGTETRTCNLYKLKATLTKELRWPWTGHKPFPVR